MFRFLFQTTRLYLLMFIPHTFVSLPGSDSYAMNTTVQWYTNKAFQPKVRFTAKHFQRAKTVQEFDCSFTTNCVISALNWQQNIMTVIHTLKRSYSKPNSGVINFCFPQTAFREEVWLSRALRKPDSLYREGFTVMVLYTTTLKQYLRGKKCYQTSSEKEQLEETY